MSSRLVYKVPVQPALLHRETLSRAERWRGARQVAENLSSVLRMHVRQFRAAHGSGSREIQHTSMCTYPHVDIYTYI